MDGSPQLDGPQQIESMKNAVGEVVNVEDFAGNIQKFRVDAYSVDFIKLEVLEGEDAGKKINIDLGAASVVDVKIKEISLENVAIFTEDDISTENLRKAQENRNTLVVGNIINEVIEDFQRRVGQLTLMLTDRGKLPNPPESDKSTLAMIDEIVSNLKEDGLVPQDYQHAL